MRRSECAGQNTQFRMRRSECACQNVCVGGWGRLTSGKLDQRLCDPSKAINTTAHGIKNAAHIMHRLLFLVVTYRLCFHCTRSEVTVIAVKKSLLVTHTCYLQAAAVCKPHDLYKKQPQIFTRSSCLWYTCYSQEAAACNTNMLFTRSSCLQHTHDLRKKQLRVAHTTFWRYCTLSEGTKLTPPGAQLLCVCCVLCVVCFVCC
jgi:hypothetical protein